MLLFLQPTVVSEHLQGRIYQTAPSHGIAIWIFMTPLPMKCDSVTSTIVQHELFLVGGTLTTTLAMSLPDSSCCTTTKTWRTLTAPPLKRTAAITFCGALLAFGGRHGKYRSKAIHIYQPATNDWSKVEDLPTA